MRAQLATLVVTDMEDSTRLVARAGDARSAELLARVDAAARGIMARHRGREIDKSDGFLLLFERPVDAVAFALELHPALAALGAEEGHELRMRVGIHLGEVILRETPAADVQRGAKQIEVEGLAKPLAARVMALAPGGRTLLTRAAFDLARRAAADPGLLPEGLQWLAHGPYVLKGVGSGHGEEPVELFEVAPSGAEGLAPPPDSPKAYRAIRPGEEELLGWRPAIGNEVRRRPGWVLREKLGEGGFGEVWLAEHARTRERRVFKFCFVWERLRSLKRELALFMLIRDALGDRPDIQRLRDLNFDEPPYFLEMDFADGGALPQWVESRGGFAAVGLAARLRIVAQVADAAAAAHSIGIIHKDIKPSNILVEGAGGSAQAKLTDFGIGQLTDKALLKQAGIDSTGFTDSTLGGTELSSRTGTRLYMAPELLAGRAPSVQSDIYALGVLLYQSIVGDFARPLTAEWEADIPDPLLREDVRDCVAARPDRRLRSAGELAVRLGSLPDRQRQRRRERLGRMLTVAASILAALAVVATAVAIPLIERERSIARREADLRIQAEQGARAAREREREAEEQRRLAAEQMKSATALAIAMLDHLGSTLDMQRAQDRALAARIAGTVTSHFAGTQTAAFGRDMKREFAASMGEAGRKLLRLGEINGAVDLSSRTLALVREDGEPRSVEVLVAMNDRGTILREAGRLGEAESLLSETLALGEGVYGPGSPMLADVLLNLGGTMNLAGRLREGLDFNRRALEIIRRLPERDARRLAHALQNVGNSERDAGSLDEAIRLHREGIEVVRDAGPLLEQEVGYSLLSNLANDYFKGGRIAEALDVYNETLEVTLRFFGPEHSNTALVLNNIGLAQLKLGRFDEARENARRALDVRRRNIGAAHQFTIRSAILLANVEMESGDVEAALEVLAECERSFAGAEVSADTEAAMHELRASLLQRKGRHAEALATAERLHALRISTKGEAHKMTADAACLRANCLTQLGRHEEAVAVLTPALAAFEPALGREHSHSIQARRLLFSAHLALAIDAEKAGTTAAAREHAANAISAIRNDPGVLGGIDGADTMLEEARRLAGM